MSTTKPHPPLQRDAFGYTHQDHYWQEPSFRNWHCQYISQAHLEVVQKKLQPGWATVEHLLELQLDEGFINLPYKYKSIDIASDHERMVQRMTRNKLPTLIQIHRHCL